MIEQRRGQRRARVWAPPAQRQIPSGGGGSSAPVAREAASGSLIEVLDRVLDKGIVIDAYVQVSFVGIDLVSVDARIVVASVQTYLLYADAISATPAASRPQKASANAEEIQPDRPLARPNSARR